jgi:hypothetical protein
MAAIAELLKGIDDQHLAHHMHKTDRGDAFGCRLEIYHSEPRAEPEPARFQAELAMRLAPANTPATVIRNCFIQGSWAATNQAL